MKGLKKRKLNFKTHPNTSTLYDINPQNTVLPEVQLIINSMKFFFRLLSLYLAEGKINFIEELSDVGFSKHL